MFFVPTHSARRHTLSRVLTCIAASVLIASGLSAVALPAHAQGDPFPVAPADLADHRPGDVLAWKVIALFGLPLPVQAWQLQYRTTGSDDQPSTSIATLIEPDLPWLGTGPRPLLSYQIAEDSLTTTCAPSATLSAPPAMSQTTLDAPFLAGALAHGWAIVLADYEGPQSKFLDGVESGRAVIDGIRAARSFSPADLADSPVALWGYSGGAFAALWAAQLHGAGYGSELPIVAVAAGGIPADLPAIARAADGGPKAGLTMLIVAALARNDPDTELAGLLNERGATMLDTAGAQCGDALLSPFAGTHSDDYADAPGLLSSPQFLTAASRQDLGATAPDIPMFLYHNSTDEVVPIEGVTALAERYCAQGSALTQQFSPLPGGHTGAAITEALPAMNYLADRFAAVPLPPNCTTS